MTFKRTIMTILTMILLMSTAISPVYAAKGSVGKNSVSDIDNHWASAQLNKWLEKGLIKGYEDGTIKPDNPITRAEFITIINHLFGFTEQMTVSFTDVKNTDWFAGEIAKANKAGYISGYPDQTFRPKAMVTREDASVLLSKAFRLTKASNNAPFDFSDAGKIKSYAKQAVETLISHGYVNGYPDHTLKPDRAVTRAEAIAMMNQISGEVFNAAGTYILQSFKGNAVINTSNVILKDSYIEGNMYLTEGIGQGDAALNSVFVTGTTFINGGGNHSIHINGSKLNKVEINNPDQSIRIVFNGTANEWVVESQAILEFGDETAIGSLTISNHVDGVMVNGTKMSSGSTAKINGGKVVKDDEQSNDTENATIPPVINPDHNNGGANPGGNGGGGGSEPGDEADPDWTLVWSDEFNGDSLDESKWNYVQGGGGYGNKELQNYTNRPENIRVENGKLIIEALKEKYQGNDYTSAKIETKSKGEWTYGRFEIKAKLPEGKGMWPAIWMMPADKDKYGGWPVGGEIDIMEFLGHDPGKIYGTIHYGNPHTHSGGNYTLPDGQKFSDDFHIFSIEWAPGELKWFVDGILYATKNEWFSKGSAASEANAYPAPFDRDFYLQLNLAVGGEWPGNPDSTTDWSIPKQLVVDYVKIYSYNGEYEEPGPRPGKNLADGWTWIREVESHWYVERNPKVMKITTLDGSFTNTQTSKPSNILLREDPVTGDYTISTKIKFDAAANFEFAGLIVYQDDGNYVSLGRAFSGSKQIRFSEGLNGTETNKNYNEAMNSPDVYFKIEKIADTFRGYYSIDGHTWISTDDVFNTKLTDPKVGLLTRKLGPSSKTAEFTEFKLNDEIIPF